MVKKKKKSPSVDHTQMGTVRFIVKQEVRKDKVEGKKKKQCVYFWSHLVGLICYREIQQKMYHKCLNSGKFTDWVITIGSLAARWSIKS